MNQHRIDSIESRQSPASKQYHPGDGNKKRTLWRVLFFVLVGISVVLASLTSKTIRSEDLFGPLSHLPIVRDVAEWTSGIQRSVSGNDDRINVLLLGMPGHGHDGFLLTDTIIFASYDPKTDHAALISIPRDLYVPIPGKGMRKINEANAYGEQDKYPGGGSALAAKTVEQIFDQKIDYYLRIDFSGFERVINLLGGIDVYVERSFVDYQYPTDNFLTQTVSFEQGWQHMDGKTALIFARSRHGSNGEGSDFARAARQQKILSAARGKILSLKILLNPKKIASLVHEVSDNIQTNVDPWEIGDLLGIANSTQGNNVSNIVLSNSPGGYLVSQNSPETGFILVPRDGTFEHIQQMINDVHLGGKIELENARVFLLNGTETAGLAKIEQTKLSKQNINVTGVANAPEHTYVKTVIYDLSNGKKDTTLKFLKNIYQANVTKKIPEFLSQSMEPDIQTSIDRSLTDFLVVLGSEANE